MAETLEINFAKPTPLFPLPGCVLLPHATIPLHVFEPRYRTMVREALDSDGLIAMATFEGEQWKEQYADTPEVRPYVCIGYIVRHERLPDGRYYILLQGVARARITQEVPHEPYRMAMLQPTEEEQPMEIDMSETRQRLEDFLSNSLLRQLAAVSAIHNWLSDEIPTTALIDLAIMHLCDDAEERYTMLAEPDVNRRALWLEDLLKRTLASLRMAERFPEPKTQEHIYLN